MADRVKAAADAKTDKDFFVIARTDAIAVEVWTARRARRSPAVEAGADGTRRGGEGSADVPQVVDAVKAPVLANITEFGATPLFTVEELKSAGAAMVLYPLSAFRAMNKAALNVYTTLRREGTQKAVVDLMQDPHGAVRTSSDTTPMSSASTRCSQERNRQPREKIHERSARRAGSGAKIKKSVALSGVVAATPPCAPSSHRERPALPRLRHPRHWLRPANSRRSRICWSTAHFPAEVNCPHIKQAKEMRGLPANVKAALEWLPASSIRWT